MTPRALMWSAAVDLGIMLAVVFGWGLDWRGEWKTTASLLMVAPFLLGPFVASVAAWASFQEHRLATLVASSRKPFLSVTRIAALTWLWAMAAWAVTAAGTSAVTAMRVGSADAVSLWPAFVMAPVALACYAAIGAAAGRLLPHWLTVVLVGAFLFALVEAMSEGWLPHLLDQGPDASSLAGMDWNVRYLLEQAAGVVALAALACLLPPALQRRSVGSIAAVGVTATALVVAAGLVGTDFVRGEVREDPAAAATECVGHRPVVCVAPEHGWIASRVRDAIMPGFRQLQRIRATVPTRIAEDFNQRRLTPRSGEFFIQPDDIDGGFAPGEAMGFLADPGGCRAFRSLNHSPADRVFDAESFIVDWLLRSTGHRPDPATNAEYAWLNSATTAQKSAWVRTTYEQLRRCSLSAIRLPSTAAKR